MVSDMRGTRQAMRQGADAETTLGTRALSTALNPEAPAVVARRPAIGSVWAVGDVHVHFRVSDFQWLKGVFEEKLLCRQAPRACFVVWSEALRHLLPGSCVGLALELFAASGSRATATCWATASNAATATSNPTSLGPRTP